MFNPRYEAMAPQERRALQIERLRWSLRHAYDNVPFYRQSFDQAGFHPRHLQDLSDLQKVPFLTKQDMRMAYPYQLFAVGLDQVVRIHCSSGTTGNATLAGYTRKDIEVFSEVVARSLMGYGVTESDVVQIAYGYGLFTGGLGLHYGVEKLGALAVPISGGNTDRQLRLIKDLGTSVLACTPSYALNIADHMARQQPAFELTQTKLRIGVFGAEPWSEQMRVEIENRLGISAYDIYGLSEIIGPGVAAECSKQSGLHVHEDHFYVEIVDPETGTVLPEGEPGEIVYTSLTKEACPVIRYRSHDMTRLYHEPCPCGRTLIKMDKVFGRSDDMMIIRGLNIYPSQIEAVLMDIECTEPHYQIILDRQDALDSIEILVEVNDKVFSDELKVLQSLSRKIHNRIKSVLSISAKITLVEPQTIARSVGKAERVIDKRKIQ
jgi:phenylacetate-CoA ligase